MSILFRPDINSKLLPNKPDIPNEELSNFKKRISFLTLGCRLNQSETDILIRISKLKGYKVVHSSEPSDFCIINTCTVTGHADSKNRQAIRNIHRLNPNADIVVIGCYAQLAHEEISKLKGVKFIIGNEQKMDVLKHLDLQW